MQKLKKTNNKGLIYKLNYIVKQEDMGLTMALCIQAGAGKYAKYDSCAFYE